MDTDDIDCVYHIANPEMKLPAAHAAHMQRIKGFVGITDVEWFVFLFRQLVQTNPAFYY